MNRANLNQTVRKDTFGKLLPTVALVCLLAIGLTYTYLSAQINLRHEYQLNKLVELFEQRLELLDTQVSSLASNDFIVNSIIDFSNRDNYLPVFFRSLKPATATVNQNEYSIVFLDFEGQLITGKNIELFRAGSRLFDWKGSVYDKQKSYTKFNDNGVLIVHPVIYGTSAEGAIAMYLPNLDQLFPKIGDEYHVIAQSNGKFVYTSHPILPDENGSLSSRLLDDVLSRGISNQISHSNLDVILLEKYGSAYDNLVWVISIAVMVILTLAIALLYAANIASKSASKVIAQLSEHISNVKNSPDDTQRLPVVVNEPREIAYLRTSFNDLMVDLLAVSSLKNRVEGIVDSLNELLVVYGPDGENLLHNAAFDAFCDSLEISAEESAKYLFPKEMIDTEHGDSNIELCHVLKKPLQQKRFMSWRKTHYLTKSGNVRGVVIAGIDITESIALQQELRIKNLAIDEAQAPIIITDAKLPGFPITYANPAFENQTGYTLDEIRGKNCKFLQGPNTAQEDIEAIRIALKDLLPVKRVIKNYRKDGTEFYNLLTLTPIHDGGGSVTHFLGLQEDVTEQKKAQAYLEQARLRAEENAMIKSRFLASMSHEIRTPMNGILGMLGLLETSDLNKQQSQHVKLAKSSADALLVLINDILDFSKIEAGKLDLEQAPFNLVELLGEIASSFACSLDGKEIEVILDTSSITNQTVVGDSGRLRQILTNLVGNAIKFTHAGHVLIKASTQTTYSERQTVRIAVSDTGVGIAKDHINKIFDSFSQIDASTTRNFGGTGLGLTICKQLAELMHGNIYVKSKEGHGSTFTLDVDFGLTLSGVATTQEFQGLNAVIYHSHSIANDTIAAQLKQLGIQVCKTSSLEEASDRIKESLPDLALLRIGARDKELSEDISIIKQLAKLDTNIVVMQSYEDLEHAGSYSELKDLTFISLPITSSNLIDCFSAVNCKIEHSAQKNKLEPEVPNTNDTLFVDGMHVLLVEDNPVNQVLEVALLEQQGLNVTVADNGKIALEMLKENLQQKDRFKFIFMDCQMPEMDGFESTRNIRRGFAGEAFSTIPIIALTANAITGDREKCLEAGMSDYMSKPIDIDMLKEKIIKWAEVALGTKESTSPQLSLVTANENNTSSTMDTRAPNSSSELSSDSMDQNTLTQTPAGDAPLYTLTSGSKQSALDQPIWNKEAALERTLGSEDLMTKVITAYLSDMPNLIDQLEGALSAEDTRLASDVAHTIRGASLNISANRLGELAATVEKYAANNETQQLKAAVSHLSTHFSELEQVLKKSIA